jgi:GH24 family phage-related lysozyme (muramidase)
MKCSQAALDLIWQEETGGDAYYQHTNECRANWPGGRSGVTIGGFYDLGYVSKAELRSDWDDVLPAAMIDALTGVVGIRGSPARSHARELAAAVSVPEAAARQVFTGREIPKWEAAVAKLPNAGKLSGDGFGALVSLAMNRGASFTAKGDRYREMRVIRYDLQAHRLTDIPAQFRAMKRLWPPNGDLWKRREHEAALFEAGLKEA